jgi:serine/threonine-protein kinase
MLEKLGPYRITRQLGRGGMGTVYAGVDESTGELAAVKVLAAALGHESGFRERFQSEIETLRMLRHDNIVRLIGFGEDQGVLFYAMELVDGVNLEEELRKGRKFTISEVLQIGIQVAAGLKHAHDRGVVHRDIKPANLMLTPQGTIKISDFGIAKLFGSSGMTSMGGVIGTAEYMAPEQADGRPVSHRSDLYSLGGVLYALVARRPPFVARSIPEVLQMQRFSQPEPLRRFDPDVPIEVEELILQLLEKDPERRVANATVLQRRLAATYHGLNQKRQTARTPTVRQDANAEGSKTHLPSSELTQAADSYRVAEADEPPPGRLPPTRSGTRGSIVRAGTRAESDAQLSATQVTAPVSPHSSGDVPTMAPSAGEVQPQRPQSAAPTTRYTTVTPEDRARRPAEEAAAPWTSPATFALLGILLLVLAGGYWFLRPPSADRLYATIQGVIDREGPDALASAESEIRDFLQRYAEDPRAGEVQGYLELIELSRAERRYNLLARQSASAGQLLPVQRAYLDAIRFRQLDPAESVARLEALLTLYGSDAASGPRAVQECLALARRQLDLLRDPARVFVRQQSGELQARLDEAEQLLATDPQQAQAVARAVVSLYADKPWAAEAVQRSRRLLEAIGEMPEPAREAPQSTGETPEASVESSPAAVEPAEPAREPAAATGEALEAPPAADSSGAPLAAP